jgi:hypothetical protein
MSYPTIPPYDDFETSGADESPANAALSSLFLRTLTVVFLVGVIARMCTTVAGLGTLA